VTKAILYITLCSRTGAARLLVSFSLSTRRSVKYVLPPVESLLVQLQLSGVRYLTRPSRFLVQGPADNLAGQNRSGESPVFYPVFILMSLKQLNDTITKLYSPKAAFG